MDKCFNKEVCNILKTAEKEMFDLHHPYVGTEHLLLALLKKEKINQICYKYNLNYQNFKEELIRIIGKATKKSEVILYTPLLNKVIDEAYKNANDDHNELDEIYLLSSLLNENDGIALRIASNMGVNIDEINKEVKKPHLLCELGINLNEQITDRIFLRDKEIDEITEILLRKNKNNPILIGHSGVGKTAIVEELARRIKAKEVPEKLLNYEIYLINTSTLIAGTKYRGEFEERVNNLVKEVIKNKNIILFIDEIHTIVKTGSSDGSIDAANILKPYLARNDLKIIGATTINEYNEYLKKDSAFARRFAPIKINEPTNNDMEYILKKIKINYENYYKLKINNKDLPYLIKMCDTYLPNQYNPDKCLDILDTCCSKKVLDNFKKDSQDLLITKDDFLNTIKLRVNIINIDKVEYEKLYNKLKSNYHEQIVKNILNIIKDNKPNKYMILNGTDSNTKEKIIKIITKYLNISLINIDCRDYNDEYSINKLINNNYLYNKIYDNPSSIIIFNNYNEASKILYNIINIIINKGYITNTNNEKLYLNNATVFLFDNSNKDAIGFNNQNNLLFT
jgi:ATP-dependent Clp protease ATP-binding subunit ClpC